MKKKADDLAALGEENQTPEAEVAATPADILQAEEDEDVIF
jgi:hypothetical protein